VPSAESAEAVGAERLCRSISRTASPSPFVNVTAHPGISKIGTARRSHDRSRRSGAPTGWERADGWRRSRPTAADSPRVTPRAPSRDRTHGLCFGRRQNDGSRGASHRTRSSATSAVGTRRSGRTCLRFGPCVAGTISGGGPGATSDPTSRDPRRWDGNAASSVIPRSTSLGSSHPFSSRIRRVGRRHPVHAGRAGPRRRRMSAMIAFRP
jgi:hypothetical protein